MGDLHALVAKGKGDQGRTTNAARDGGFSSLYRIAFRFLRHLVTNGSAVYQRQYEFIGLLQVGQDQGFVGQFGMIGVTGPADANVGI